MRQRPVSVTRAVLSSWALLGLGLVTTVLTVVLRDDLIAAWADGNPSRTGADASVSPPSFVPVSITLFIVAVLLFWVLLAFVRGGHPWARFTMTGLLVLVAIGTVAGIRTDPPAAFVVLALLSFVVELVVLVYLWHRDTTEYFRGTWLVARERV